jgi:hypothetical protein
VASPVLEELRVAAAPREAAGPSADEARPAALEAQQHRGFDWFEQLRVSLERLVLKALERVTEAAHPDWVVSIRCSEF